MGSKSDLPVMQKAIDILTQFGVESEVKIVSAHRTPEMMFQFAQEAKVNGLILLLLEQEEQRILPGMVASIVPLPVIGFL